LGWAWGARGARVRGNPLPSNKPTLALPVLSAHPSPSQTTRIIFQAVDYSSIGSLEYLSALYAVNASNNHSAVVGSTGLVPALLPLGRCGWGCVRVCP
jgi:hypothetical protein